MNDKEHVTLDQQVVPQLAEVAVVMTSMLGRLMETHESQAIFGKDVEYLRNDLRATRDIVAKIARVLHEGNGQKPLVSRVAVLEERADEMKGDFTKIEENKQISKKGRYVLAAALSSGLLGFAASLLSLLISN